MTCDLYDQNDEKIKCDPMTKSDLWPKNIFICHKSLMWPNGHMWLLWSEDYWAIKMWPNEELWQTHKVWPND